MKKLDFLADNSVDEIELIHSAEHIGRNEYKNTFREWYRVLKPGGLLRINVPDLLWVAKQLIENNGDLDANKGCPLRDCIYGDQSAPGQIHTTGFTKTSITKDLKDVGFSEVNVQEGFWHNEQLCIDVIARK
jgi:ubiquinone/menaquinone biosynthesis C-methylase UbiE